MLSARPVAAALRQRTCHGLMAGPPPMCAHLHQKADRSGVERVQKLQIPAPRLDYNQLLADQEATTRNAKLRKVHIEDSAVERLAQLRKTHLELEKTLNKARKEHGEVSHLFRDEHRKRDKKNAIKHATETKNFVKATEHEYRAVEAEMLELALSLPNWSHPSAPIGAEANAVEVDRFGPDPIPADERRDHVHVAKYFGWMDTSASALAVGASWPFLVGAFAQLEHALVSYALTIACSHGFTPVAPPNVVTADVAARCGFQPRDGPDGPKQTYSLDSEEGDVKLCLAGTAEIPLAAMIANRTLYRAALPTKVVAVGRAYRAEAGARGLDTRGLYRVHEFTKVEMFSVAAPEESDALLEEMRALQREVAEGLGLTVRVLDMPTEELGASASRKYDMEAWMPGRGKWGEISSASNCTDYQARRLHIKYRADSTQKPQFAHTLNATAAAIPRLILALVENGVVIENDMPVRVELPKVLERFWIGSEADGVIRFV